MMEKKFLLLVFISVSILLFNSCSNNKNEPIKVDPAFRQYITAFTSGVISKESPITIELANDNMNYKDDGKPIDESLFEFEPDVKGEAYWIDQHTIEFHPDKPLSSGENYICEFDLDKLIKDLPKKLRTLKFGFQTIKQSFSIDFNTYKPYEKTKLGINKITGTVTTTDVVNDDDIQQLLTATQDGKQLNITWEKGGDRIMHHFQIEKVVRKETAGEVLVNWNGKAIGVDITGEKKLEIPSLSDFKVMDITVVQQPEQYLAIDFSDPLKETQNLDGLITLEDDNTLRFSITDNQIKVYPPVRQKGTKKIFIEPGIQNILGYKMKKHSELEVTFEDLKPAVKLIGKGVIIPTTANGLIFPFQAVNLKAVDVKVVQIYENNIAQFLQVNHLNGQSQLKRVGRIIHKETIQLISEKPIDYGKWNSFSFDLSKLIAVQPGAIYRIELSFKKAYSLYPCDENESTDNSSGTGEEQWNTDNPDEEETSWDYYEDYYDDDYDYYYYDDNQDDPCYNSYYNRSRFVSRNVLASDMGIIAKSGTNNDFIVVVSDLKTTKPLSGILLKFYNFQNQLMGTVKTGDDGFAKIKFDHKPFLIVAENGKQRGYLRVDDGSSLSLSNFDVSGQVIQKGIKGFIYGERGVWRPGDSLFVMFILEDPDKLLPENHPVVFEMYNPNGQLTNHIVKTQSINGFYNFATVTDPDAPTGNWTVKIKVGGVTFSKRLKIETIKPNRLKIKLDFGTDKITSLNKNLSGQLHVAWLSGATAGNLKVNITATMTPMTTSFKKYKDFTFDDPARYFYPDEITVFDGKIDENGNASVGMNLDVSNDAPGMLKAHFVVRAFEEGGDFSIDRFSIPYSPYDTYVGIRLPKGDKRGMLLTDTDQTVDVVTVDDNGNPVSVHGLKAEVYKVEWRWWWSNDNDDLASYINSSYHQPIVKKTLNTNNQGRGKFSFRIDYPEWGRYLVRVYNPQNGHATGKTVYIDWPGWAGRNQRKNPEGATMLVFNSDKTKYFVGENIKVNFPSSKGGRALVSIESGSKIIDAYWVETQQDETSFSVKATKKMTPNVFIHITLVQPYQTTANDLPIRLYGVIPISVEDPETKLHPVIEMPNVLAPEKNVTINVKEKDGKPMTYTIAMVDEGLLDLTRFSTPDPWKSFYAREALGVKTWDMYDYVLGAYGGKIAQLFAIGGDGELQGGKAKKANRFKPMVKFLGPFTLKAGERQSHTFMMPRYIGSVRTMVIAGYGNAYGNAEKTTPVRKPLMVLATFPRVVGPGETVKLPVTVFAMEKKVRNVTVTVKTNNFFTGEKQKTVSFTKTGDKVINFDLQVTKRIGIGKIHVTAKSGSEKADYDFEIDVRNPNPPVTDYYETIIQPGQSWSKDYVPVGISGTNSGKLEVSNIPPIDFGRRLKYLLQYPYGCVEQTTSSVFPQLFLENVMDVDSKMKTKINTNIRAAIKRLKSFQLPNGGLGYWANSDYANDWGTSYAGHFLLEAEKKGYQMPIGFKKKWLKYQKKEARNWSPKSKKNKYYYENDDLIQAYRLYTLALAKEPVLGAMNRLREQPHLSIQARWRLAAAYVLAGQPEVAKELTNSTSATIKPYTEMSYSYGSDDRDRAMILETMSLMNERNRAIPVMKQVSKALSSNRWMSTQTTAYCLIAIAEFAGKNGTSKTLKFTYNIGKGNINASTQMPVSQIDLQIKGTKRGKVFVKNTGKGIIYARISLNGIPEAGNETAASNNLTMKVRYLNMNGNPININTLTQGTDFMAEVTVHNPGILGNYKEMALTQIFPSGWEIHNVRMDDFTNVHEADIPTYRDIRDDRVYSFFDISRGKTKTFRVLLNATYQGKFYLPAVGCEAMYDHQISARVPGQWVEVVKQ